MRDGALNGRLFSAAEFVRQGAVFADVGTDHAYLPLFLLGQGRIEYAYCTDINKGPLDSARRNAGDAGMTDKMDFILTDGAAALSGRGITDIAVCGMGGELIADIVERAPHLKDEGVNLILQPMSKQAALRKYLASSGFTIECESYSCDACKYYVCLLARYTGNVRAIDDIEAELGNEKCEFVNKSARIGYIKTKISSYERMVRGKIAGGDNDPREACTLEAMKALLSSLIKENE